MSKSKICPNCSAENLQNARYCQNCGKSLSGLKGKIGAFKQRMEYQAREKYDIVKGKVDNKISEYLVELDTPEPKIRNRKIPDSKRDSIRNALLSFQDKMGTVQTQPTAEFNVWLNDLPNMLDDQKCLVCFGKWETDDDIVVCVHCQSGGHRTHLENWVTSKNLCPLCRQNISKRDLLTVKLNK